MNITEQEATDIINRMSQNFIDLAEKEYKLSKSIMIDRLLLLFNSTSFTPTSFEKDKIDLAIIGSLENNEYYQYYFLIVETGKLTPHYIERLERRKIEIQTEIKNEI